jgi:hypothetical protein
MYFLAIALEAHSDAFLDSINQSPFGMQQSHDEFPRLIELVQRA